MVEGLKPTSTHISSQTRQVLANIGSGAWQTQVQTTTDCWNQNPKLAACAVQVQREAAGREYANLRLQQPYERALYDQEMALQMRRWHVSEYEAVVADLTPERLKASLRLTCPFMLVQSVQAGHIGCKQALMCAPGAATPWGLMLNPVSKPSRRCFSHLHLYLYKTISNRDPGHRSLRKYRL